MKVEDLLSRLDKVKVGLNDSWKARCPAHLDKTPSLTITVRPTDNAILLHCFGGCPHEAVMEALDLVDADLFNNNGTTPPPRPKDTGRKPQEPKAKTQAYPTIEAAIQAVQGTHVATWDYTPSFCVARFNTADGKTFRPFHHDPDGWRQGDPDGKLPLYRLPELMQSEGPVFIPEGEKHVDALRALGLNATTSSHGSSSAHRSDWSPTAGRELVLLPDNDPAGEKYDGTVAGITLALVPPASVKILPLPGLPPGGDVIEFIEARTAEGKTPDQIRDEILALANEAEEAKDENRLPQPVRASDWLRVALTPPEQVLVDTLDRGGKCMVVGPSKSRKTFFMIQKAVSIAAGIPDFLGFEIPGPRPVLFFNLEVSEFHMQRRLSYVCHGMGIDPGALDNLFVVNLRGHHIGLHRLDDLRQMAQDYDAEVVMFDPLYKLHDGDENKAQDVKPVLRMFDQICEDTGASITYSHHDSKGSVAERQTIDRGAGSNVIARDFDTAFYLADHAEEDLLVVQTITRAYKPREAVSVCWEDGAFHLTEDDPVLKTRNKSGRVGPDPTNQDAVDLVLTEPMPITKFFERLRAAGFTDRDARSTRDGLLANGTLAQFREAKFHGFTWIGMPDHIHAKQEEAENAQKP